MIKLRRFYDEFCIFFYDKICIFYVHFSKFNFHFMTLLVDFMTFFDLPKRNLFRAIVAICRIRQTKHILVKIQEFFSVYCKLMYLTIFTNTCVVV